MRLPRIRAALLGVIATLLGGTVRAGPTPPEGAPRQAPLPPAPAGPGSAEAPKPTLWAVIIGISAYKDAALSTLKYADRDAQALCDFVQTPMGGGFKPENIRLLVNEEATRDAIWKALRGFLKKPGESDFVLIHIACHGGVDPERPQEAYLLPYDTDPADIATTAIHMKDTFDALPRTLRAQRAVFLMDTCYAGAAGPSAGARDAPAGAETVNQFLQQITASKPGWGGLAAAQKDEVAKEGEQWGGGHGVFTWQVLEGLQGRADRSGDGRVQASELFAWVAERVEAETGNKQHPAQITGFDPTLVLSIPGGQGAVGTGAPSYEADLTAAQAAVAADDGEAVRAALVKAVAHGAPAARVLALVEYVRRWNEPPTLTITRPLPQGRVPSISSAPWTDQVVGNGLNWRVMVEGQLVTNRQQDRVFVDGEEAVLTGGRFLHEVARTSGGTASIAIEVQYGAVVRASARATVELLAPPGRVSQEQIEEAGRLGVPVAYEEPTTGIRFVLIPGRSFLLGSPAGEAGRFADEGPQRRVTIRPFYLAIHEVTNKQYRHSVPGHKSGDGLDGVTQPVVSVDHAQATAYASWLSQIAAGPDYRLPAESEWEHACRAGTTTRWSFGDDESRLGDHAWFVGNGGGTTHPVGEKAPNPWGLFDMHGNPWEWCADDWHDGYEGVPTDGHAWIDSPRAARRVLRGGGGWIYPVASSRSAGRTSLDPSFRGSSVGFRLARALAAH